MVEVSKNGSRLATRSVRRLIVGTGGLLVTGCFALAFALSGSAG
jgi:hypothetical protein